VFSLLLATTYPDLQAHIYIVDSIGPLSQPSQSRYWTVALKHEWIEKKYDINGKSC